MDEDHTYFVATASGDEAVWVHNADTTVPPGFSDTNCHKPNQVPTTPAQSSPGTWELLKAVVIGLNEGYEQGNLNLLNGGTDLVIHTANTAVQVTPSIWVLNWMGVDTTIPAPDWSRNRVCPESDSVHWWSKTLAENGIALALPGLFGKTVPKGGPTPPPLPGPTVAAAEEVGAKSAIEIAREGGTHSGFLKNYASKAAAEWRKGIQSIEKQIAEHRDKIANPEKFIPDFKELDPRQQKALLERKWPSDIRRQQQQLDILKGLLEGE